MTLQIVRLTAENYKRLVAVDISPTGNIVTLAGKNAQGKTSILDAIWAALAGGDASRATKQPIRDGQESATVRLDLGDYIVTRKWTADDAGTLTVETPPTADGRKQKYSSPQKLLDDIVGKRAFDPLAFTRMSAGEQVQTLIATVDLPFDPAELDRERAGVFDGRADLNRQVKQLEGQLSGLSAPTDSTPDAEVSVADVIAEFEKAREHNAKGNALHDSAIAAEDVHEKATAEIVRLRDALDAAIVYEERAGAVRKSTLEATKAFKAIETDAISERLGNIEQTNATVRAATEHRRTADRLAAKREEAAQFTIELQTIDKRKADALGKVKFPVEGLSFDSNGVLYNGIPFAQASAAEQLRVSAALAMASNPELRVLQVRDGSLLDSDSMKILTDLAAEREFQVWLEVVGDDPTVGIIIEDGQVRS